MARGGFWVHGDPEKVKFKDGKKFCETQYCYAVVKRYDKHCSYCQLNRYSEIYTERCHACWRRALKTSGYCDQHKQKCLSCDSREIINKGIIYKFTVA